MRIRPILLAVALVLAGSTVVALQVATPEFPHQAHERLFPVCEGCHTGVVTGEAEMLYPDPASCAQCHDGERQKRVEWTPPGPRPSNLRFFHPEHRELVREADEEATCSTCHVSGDPPVSRMSVGPPRAEFCLGCHTHATDVHIAVTAGVECSACHISLVEAERLTVERVAAFPKPPSHEEPDFLSRHAPGTPAQQFSCSVCHSRDTCERCHLNADRLPEVDVLLADPRIAFLLLGRGPEYPLPETHLDPSWDWAHGRLALSNPGSCANCHTQPACLSCHLQGTGRAVALEHLPRQTPERPRGVQIARGPGDVHPADFTTQHGAWAATGALQCAQCHTERYCADCHAGSDSREFHPSNFMERHAVEVFAGRTDCQSCHSTETFCRDCHVSTGIASAGRMDVAFHTAQPLWLLTHGQAARTNLASCTACHRQTDCLACHSTIRGWGVSPHGPGFDANRVAARNRATCQWCHLGDPLSGI
jgi:hypothetical protein